MKIISWNVNGIRAWYKKGSFDLLIKKSPDFICLQETKAHPDQLEKDFPEIFKPNGYESYFDWSKIRKGYSGVVTYTKVKPDKVTFGLGDKEFDQEGRQVNLFFKKFVLINCYFPNGGKSKEHFDFKLKYYKKFLSFVNKLENDGYSVVFVGDFNVAHNEIDLARPKENEKSIGFLPAERQWVDSLEENNFVDTFRETHPLKVQYSWWDMKTRSRDRNVGWRLDYIFVSNDLFSKVNNSLIHDSIFGSDHCPVSLDINLNI